jgi:hypothetical protein
MAVSLLVLFRVEVITTRDFRESPEAQSATSNLKCLFSSSIRLSIIELLLDGKDAQRWQVMGGIRMCLKNKLATLVGKTAA